MFPVQPSKEIGPQAVQPGQRPTAVCYPADALQRAEQPVPSTLQAAAGLTGDAQRHQRIPISPVEQDRAAQEVGQVISPPY